MSDLSIRDVSEDSSNLKSVRIHCVTRLIVNVYKSGLMLVYELFSLDFHVVKFDQESSNLPSKDVQRIDCAFQSLAILILEYSFQYRTFQTSGRAYLPMLPSLAAGYQGQPRCG